jgi:hypothetical protein
MKTILYTLAILGLLSIGCRFIHAQTNPAPASVSTADSGGVQLTPAETASLDNGLNSVLTFIPAQYKGLIITLAVILSTAGRFGTYFKAFKTGGVWNMIKSVFNHHTTALLLICGFCSLAFTGCAERYQYVQATSATGVKINATVPVLGTGTTFIGLALMGGTWKESSVLQPTTTNGAPDAPSVAITQNTRDKAGVSGNVGGTNSAAGIDASGTDINYMLTGESTETSTNLNLTTKK